MKFTKHQKDIIRGINSGKIYNIYSYIDFFGMMDNFRIDKSIIESKFQEEEKGKTYRVLKPGINAVSMHFNPATFNQQTTFNKLNDSDFYNKPAMLVYYKTIITKEYREQTYIFDPCNVEGINISHSFEQIKEFMTIWEYLQKELYVLEVPRNILKEEIGLFFEVYSKKDQEEKDWSVQLKQSGFTQCGLDLPLEKLSTINMDFLSSHNAPEIDAYKYIDEFLKFNDDAFIICNHYLDKKIVGTPELELFVRRHFKTTEQLNFYWALVPAYIAIVISILLPLMQKQDNTETIKIQQQLTGIHQELFEIKTANLKLQEMIDKLDNMDIERYDDTELKHILTEIKELLANENNHQE
jgi:hypothetical protein